MLLPQNVREHSAVQSVVNRSHSGVSPGRASLLRRQIVRLSDRQITPGGTKEGVASKLGRASGVYRFLSPLDSPYRMSSASTVNICIPVNCAQQDARSKYCHQAPSNGEMLGYSRPPQIFLSTCKVEIDSPLVRNSTPGRSTTLLHSISQGPLQLSRFLFPPHTRSTNSANMLRKICQAHSI